MTQTVFLKVSSAFTVGGRIAKAGEIVEVSEGAAKDLLHRGKATLATSADAPQPTVPSLHQLAMAEQPMVQNGAEEERADDGMLIKSGKRRRGK